MSRPYVKIDAANQILTLRQHLSDELPRMMAFAGVVGLTLNGGMSRGYADHLSEVDITVFLTPEAFKTWQTGKTPIATGITLLNGQLFDIKVVDYVSERERVWENETLWDASYAEILFDPKGLLSILFSEKLKNRPDPGAAEGLLMSSWWYFALAGEIWLHRGDALQGHHMCNQAVVSLVQALFVANQEYIPHEKWLFHMSRSLAWTPANWENRLSAAMSTRDAMKESLKERQAVIGDLWEDIDQYIKEKFFPHLPVYMMQKTVYEQLKLLVSAGSMPLDEWRNHFGGKIPNGDPFHPVIRLSEDRIILDYEALLRIGPEEMYAWHYAVLKSVAEELRD